MPVVKKRFFVSRPDAGVVRQRQATFAREEEKPGSGGDLREGGDLRKGFAGAGAGGEKAGHHNHRGAAPGKPPNCHDRYRMRYEEKLAARGLRVVQFIIDVALWNKFIELRCGGGVKGVPCALFKAWLEGQTSEASEKTQGEA